MKPIPDSVAALIDELEEMYPPRCKTPEENIEAHQRYAGMSELTEILRRRYEWTRDNARMTDILKGT